ncbi:hypothetical protein EW146_g9135 [Bondarzewia mesenterica]|uniref:Uncharacterized protein n=1 Tax=Bondarzewia mesenterica TaxID=1095465 RepID=A0A4S4L8Y0_9AGAM|nr:hypothetical protein EW146_g9135 [Bondarzewia mesenterica]
MDIDDLSGGQRPGCALHGDTKSSVGGIFPMETKKASNGTMLRNWSDIPVAAAPRLQWPPSLKDVVEKLKKELGV